MTTTTLPSPLPAPRELTYEPLDTVPVADHRQRVEPVQSATRCECPTCGSLKAPGQIVTHNHTGGPCPAEWSVRFDCVVVHRSAFCAGCEHVIHWIERCTIDGKPSGEILSGPGFYSGARYVRDYLLAHPQAAEVEQA